MIASTVESLRRETGLLWSIYRLELRTRRRHHLLGLAWVAVPILLAIALAVAGRGSRFMLVEAIQGIPYPVFVLTGLFVWQSFAEGMLMPLRQVEAYRSELTSGRMTPEMAIATGSFDLLLAIAVRVGVAAAAAAVFDLPGGWRLGLMVAPFLAAAGLGLALGIVLALPGLLIRDVGRGMNLFLAIGLVASPIFYAAGPSYWSAVNPLAGWVGDARSLLLGQEFSAQNFVIHLVAIAAALAASLVWLRRGRHPFLDTLA